MKELSLIWWQDAYVTLEAPPNTVKLTQSVGWIVKKDKEFYTVSHFWDGISDELQDPYTIIPVGMVRKIEKLWTKSSGKK